MSKRVYPAPLFAPLDRVMVFERHEPPAQEAAVLGEGGTILWRSSYYVHGEPPEHSGWLYVVRIRWSSLYEQVEESRLFPMGVTDPSSRRVGASI